MVHRDYNVGVIGFGLAGQVFHAPLVAATPGLRVRAIVTGDAERQAQAGREYPSAAIVSSPDALWDLRSELDLVVVATPNASHVPLARAALERGLHVVVDKPLATSAAEARDLVAYARLCNRLISVFQNRRWDGDFLTIRRLIREGALGQVFRFESRFERWRPQPKAVWRESAAPGDAGGTLFDLGSHLIDQALTLFGPARDVYTELDVRRTGVVVDDDAFVAITHQSGVRSHLWMSATAAQVGPRFRVLGTKAGYQKAGLDGQEDALRSGARPVAGQAWGEEPESTWGVIGAGDAQERVRTEPGQWPAFYAGVAAALRGEVPMPVDPASVVPVLEIIGRARSRH